MSLLEFVRHLTAHIYLFISYVNHEKNYPSLNDINGKIICVLCAIEYHYHDNHHHMLTRLHLFLM